MKIPIKLTMRHDIITIVMDIIKRQMAIMEKGMEKTPL
jgi:hypothetical protein